MSDPPPGPATRLDAAKDWLRDRLHTGARCPLCNQRAQVYRRSINSGMVIALITMYRAGGVTMVHKPTVLRGVAASARDESLLRYWGLLEEEKVAREDGGRAVYWRVTERGEAWLKGQLLVQKYALVYDGRCLGLDGDEVSPQDALGDKFDLRELLNPAETFPTTGAM